MRRLFAPFLACAFAAAAAAAEDQAPPAERPAPLPSGSPPAPADSAAQTPEPALGDLTAGEIRAALERLGSEEALAEVFAPDAQARALLAGLLESHPALVWRARKQAEGLEIPARFHQLPSALYLRAGSLARAGAASLGEALERFREARAAAPALPVVLDFRAADSDAEPHLAASVASLFAPKGELLFSLREGAAGQPAREFRSAGAPSGESGLVFLLTDRDVAGAAEAAAAAVAARTGALVIGEETAGRLSRIGRLAVREGFDLEFLRGRIEPFGGEGKPASAPLVPAFPVKRPALAKQALFKRADEDGIEAVISETSRPRFNEAALVAGVNPEIAALEEITGDKAREEKSRPAADPVLKAALDLAEAFRIQQADPLRPE